MDSWMGSALRAKQVRKKKVRRVPKHSSERAEGQLSMAQAEKIAWEEKVRWKGGLVRFKNTREAFEDGDE